MFESYQANALASVTSQLQTKIAVVASGWSWLGNENTPQLEIDNSDIKMVDLMSTDNIEMIVFLRFANYT